MNTKQQEIIKRAYSLFQKMGIKSVSMDDIAKDSGISKKTLYEQVGNKEKLVALIIDFKTQENLPHNIDFSQINAIDVLFFAYKNAIQFFKDFNFSMEHDLQKYYPKIYEKCSKRRRIMIYEKMVANMEMGRKEGSFRDDFNIDIIAKLHVMKIEAILQTDIFQKDNYSIVEIFKELFTHHFMGIATPQGIKVFKHKLKELDS